MRNGIARLEARVEQMVEGAFARLFSGRLHPHDVALELARAMEDGALADADGSLRAPEAYRVRINPQDASVLAEAGPDLADRLADELIALAHAAGMRLSRRPEVRLVPDASLSPCVMVVEAAPPPVTARGDTLAATPAVPPAPSVETAPLAFLIVDGRRHVPLDRPVVTIGRRLDNHIVLDDPRVSRAHAQIRRRHGRWVLFDGDSTGGTRVNDQAAAEWVLRSGDVISLAGVTLIYGEDDAPDAAGVEETGHTKAVEGRGGRRKGRGGRGEGRGERRES